MNTSSESAIMQDPAWTVRQSPIHGRGVFAQRHIEAGECIIEYLGTRIPWEEATRRAEVSGTPINHTFFFSLADGRVIDGGDNGNEARYINHACEGNCEALEDEDGRVFIYALGDIEPGEELVYNYALIYEERHTKAVKKAFACYCGSPNCTGTMLAPKKRKSEKKAEAKAEKKAEKKADKAEKKESKKADKKADKKAEKQGASA
jgi:SET domain-containing protein